MNPRLQVGDVVKLPYPEGLVGLAQVVHLDPPMAAVLEYEGTTTPPPKAVGRLKVRQDPSGLTGELFGKVGGPCAFQVVAHVEPKIAPKEIQLHLYVREAASDESLLWTSWEELARQGFYGGQAD